MGAQSSSSSPPSSTDKAPETKAAPGIVFGPDGKPCKPCTSFRNWKPPRTRASKVGAVSGAAAVATAPLADPDTRPAHCPADVEQLGRATWTFLHTTAAYYPERPTPHQRANMLNLLHSLSVLYPCSHCASHLGEEMKTKPPDVSGRLGLSRWLCERHNDVNERLGKTKFDCSLKSTDERWKDGPADGSCD